MKKYVLIIGAVLLAAISLVGFAGVANATRFKAGDNVSVSKTETVDGTLFAAGSSVDVASEVNGDVFCAGQTITISGTVHGDIICAGQSIEITGAVDGDVRLAGQTVSINSKVGGNATVAGQTFTLGSNGNVAGDVTLGSASATLNGAVGRDLVAGGSSVMLANTVGRDVTGQIEHLSLSSNAKVGGAINYTSNNDLSKASGAEIAGKVTRTEPPQDKQQNKPATVFGIAIGWFFYVLASMLLVSMAIALVMPGLLHRTTDKVRARPLVAPVVGIAATVVVPIIIILLAVTVIGIPLAVIVGLLWLAVLMLSGPFFAYLLGRMVLRDSNQPLFIMLIGALVLLIMYFIPIIGVIAFLAAIWYGAGMILLEITERIPRPVYTIETGSKSRGKR